MTTTDKRDHPRVRSLNLLSYVCVDENQDVVRQGMGRTLDVSEGGILLETHAPIDLQHTISLTIGLEDDLTDITGKVVYCRAGEPGKFESGIEFQEKDEAGLRILKEYIKAFREQEEETYTMTE
ncbi:MAG: PilZ domain-containing protein [Desulfobacteria bacterium]|jgi:hypothetical protein